MYVHFKLLDGKLPKKQTENSAGYDVFSAISLNILPKSIGLIRLGFCIEIETGFEAQIRSRSGLALKKQVFVLNSPGTIDADYRGEVSVILMNLSSEIFHVDIGDRIAQLVFGSVYSPNMEVVLELSGSKRASGGFGSTGC